MTVYAINGLGRIGKLALKPLLERGAKIAWINDAVGDAAMQAHLLEFDTVHGRWDADFSSDDDSVTVDGTRLPFIGTGDLSALPLDGVDVVIDCTGVYKTQTRLAPYFDAGVKKVVVSAPVKDGPTANIVYGVNHEIYDPAAHRVVTAASCTTNCLAPVVKVIHEAIGIRHGSITTIHDVTNTQTIVDRPAKDLRRARSALNSMIPTTTGSATAITLIYPELKGRLNGHAVRVPLLNASITDCVFEMDRATTAEEVNALFKAAAEGPLQGILGYEERPLVSADYTNDTRSGIIDAPSTMVINGTQLKVYAWYDNEMGYAHRLVDVAMMVGASILTTRPEGLSAYIAVTAAYWAFMLTDGALRMLVLLHFHILGFTPVQLAYLFVLYEIAGMITNLCAGWIAARFGLTATLYAGLGLQVLALLALAQLDPGWAVGLSVAYVMLVQGASGVAKDLAKMSSKSAVKLLAPAEGGGLFRWVALLTGSKNAVKGLGFLLGAALLATIGFVWAVLAMALVLAMILIAVLLAMPPGLPRGRKGAKFSEVFSKSANVNWLSGARVFLFGARDVWFVVGLPVYFYAVLSDGTVEGNRAAFFMIGSFMALWIILYGAVQASAPRILRAATRPEAELIGAARGWAWALAVIPAALTVAALMSAGPQPWLTVTLICGLLAFGAVFAVNSALHSYLILAFTQAERVTMDLGFYYMANAGGRLAGTLLSGLTYQAGGLPLMLGTAALMVVASALAVTRLAPEPPQSAAQTPM